MHKYVIYFLFAVVCISFVLMFVFVLSFQGEAHEVEGEVIVNTGSLWSNPALFILGWDDSWGNDFC
jgi:hypothetical protein